MKVLFPLMLLIVFASCENEKYDELKNIKNSEADYPIVPKPVSLEILDGKFLIDEDTRIFASEEVGQEASLLSEMLKTATGKNIAIVNASEGNKRGIYLTLDDDIQNNEGYSLIVYYDNIKISAKSAKGIFYGIQSLRQLMLPGTEKSSVEELTIPAVNIKDEPRYAYRGMLLDVGRHMFPVDFIKKYIDLIAMHKMNTFQWHLTDDQGWRIEIKKYPRLTEIGSIRKETQLDKNHNPYIGDGKVYGGFYSQEEIKDIVAYAQAKHVTIIPEIELPGHSRAAQAAYPELGNTGPHEVATKWGIFEEIYAPKEETFEFLEGVLTEVMELFPSEYIHIGGDEAPKKEWEESSLAQEVIKREGLKDEHELQSYFIQRIERFLNKNGRKIIGWDEILEGGLAPNATVMSWRGVEGGIAAAKQGHNVIMTPNSYVYFDYHQANPEGEPVGIGGHINVEKVYSFEPTPNELSDEEAKHILGAQANLWTEYIKTSDHVEYMVLPRMSALAEVLWTNSENKDWEDFKKRLKLLSKRYDALGLNYAKHIFQGENQEEYNK
ncbi:MAG: beta-N-acetylhexosaminidase [Fulvivirga sp.]